MVKRSETNSRHDPYLEIDRLCVAMERDSGALVAGVDVGSVLIDITPHPGIHVPLYLRGRMTHKCFPVICRTVPSPREAAHQFQENVTPNEFNGEFMLKG
jgi:hypothetical protein